MGRIWLKPKPITTTEYHDWYLVGLSVSPGSAELRVKHPEGRETAIRLSGVKDLVASDFLAGNIVDYVACHAIDSPEVAEGVIGDLLEFGSQYYTERDAAHARESDRLLGLIYVSVGAIYGANVSVVARSVTEIEVGA
jgi:hypothetical protein